MSTIARMELGQLVVFAHGSLGTLPDIDDLMFLLPGLPMLLIAAIVVAAALRKYGLLGAAERTIETNAAIAAVAATLSTGAAAIHFAVIPEHLAEYVPFGLLFLGLASFQVAWAQVYLLQPGRIAALVAVVVNAGAAVVWLVSRTVGLPIGPEPWLAEPIGALDLFATGFEIALLAALLPRVMPARWPGVATRPMAFERAFVLAAFTIAAVTSLTAFALLAAPGVEAGLQP